MKKVITTVGTSLLDKLKVRQKPLREKTFSSDWNTFGENILELNKEIAEKISSEPVEKLCAEIETLLEIKKYHKEIEAELICTDTILSVICADTIKPILEKKGIAVNFDHNPDGNIVHGLVVEGKDASSTFKEKGFPNLIQRILEIEENCPKDNRPILNISGGYKALIPVMTIMGQLYDMEVNYVYEESGELISIPKVPMDFDFGLLEDVIPFIDDHYLFKDKKERVIEQFPKHIKLLKKNNLITGDSFPYKPTFIGKLIKEYCETSSFYSQKSTLSHIVEYKIFEFFAENPNVLGLNYPYTPIRSEIIEINGRTVGEIDILLRVGNLQADDYAIVEVKSFAALLGNRKKRTGETVTSIEAIKDQLKNRQIKPLSQKRGGKKPNHVIYVIYQMLNGIDESNERLKKLLKQLKSIVEQEIDDGEFLAFLLSLSSFKNDNFYKNLLEAKVKPFHLKQINI